MAMQEFETIEEVSKKWRVSVERLQSACDSGAVEGAALLNGVWIIPKDAIRPHIKNPPKKVTQPPSEFTSPTGDTIIAKTPIQGVVIDAINQGKNLGWASEHKVGGTTYIVSNIFQRQGLTAGEHLVRLAELDARESVPLGSLSADQRKEIQALKDSLRRNDPVFTLSFEEKMEAERKKLEQYGFKPDEIEKLMEKIKADYEEPSFDIQSSRRK